MIISKIFAVQILIFYSVVFNVSSATTNFVQPSVPNSEEPIVGTQTNKIGVSFYQDEINPNYWRTENGELFEIIPLEKHLDLASPDFHTPTYRGPYFLRDVAIEARNAGKSAAAQPNPRFVADVQNPLVETLRQYANEMNVGEAYPEIDFDSEAELQYMYGVDNDAQHQHLYHDQRRFQHHRSGKTFWPFTNGFGDSYYYSSYNHPRPPPPYYYW